MNFCLLSLLLLTASSCSLLQKTSLKEKISLTVRTSPCFGACPVYELRLENGLASYYGLKYPRTQDTLRTILSNSELDSIEYIFESHNYWDFENEYDNPNVSDLPSIFINYRSGEQQKALEARANIPDELIAILEYLERMRLRTFEELKG